MGQNVDGKNTEWEKTSFVTNVDWDERLISKKADCLIPAIECKKLPTAPVP